MKLKVQRPVPWLISLAIAGSIVFGGIGYVVRQKSNSKINLNELTVTVTRQDLSAEIAAGGRVEPIKSVNVSPKNPGRLVKLLVEQGDRVAAGQTLAVMENLELQAQNEGAIAELAQTQANFAENSTKIEAEIEQARARLNRARARLNGAKARIPTNIAQTKAQIVAAESRLKLVTERVERNKYLLSQGGIAQDTFDEVFNDYQNALSGIEELKQQLQQLETTGGSEVEELQAEINEAQIALKQRQQTAADELAGLQAAIAASAASQKRSSIQYEDTIIKAPFEGIVTQRYAVEGAFVTPSTSASSTASASATSILALAQGLEVVAKVTELDIGQLQPSQQVKIFADAYPEEAFLGRIERIAPEAVIEDNVTSFEVRIRLVTGRDLLRSKMNVDVIFLGKTLADTLVVPTVAIVTQDGETGVMIPGDRNKPKFRAVKIGLSIEDKTQIVSGIDAGEKVFIDLPEEKKSKK